MFSFVAFCDLIHARPSFPNIRFSRKIRIISLFGTSNGLISLISKCYIILFINASWIANKHFIRFTFGFAGFYNI